jgi:hypothetical protein
MDHASRQHEAGSSSMERSPSAEFVCSVGTASVTAQACLSYESALAKGRKILSIVESSLKQGSDRVPAQNKFTLRDLSKWGWCQGVYVRPNALHEYADMLASLNSNSILQAEGKGGDNVGMSFDHADVYHIKRKSYEPTEAHYSGFLNWKAGLLIAHYNFGPQDGISRYGLSDSPLPELQHWSDLAFLQWKMLDQIGVGHGPLRYVLRASIANTDTIAIVSHVLGMDASYQPASYASRPLWPGVSFSMDQEQAHAILGTPNGSGVGWLLAQHQGDPDLGRKVLDKVTVFFSRKHCLCSVCSDDPLERVNLLFSFKDADADN